MRMAVCVWTVYGTLAADIRPYYATQWKFV